MGIMISAYTGFVIGFGGATLPELNSEVLSRINAYRQGEYSKYIDEESAVEVTGKSEKELFTSAQQVKDVFLTKFEYGKDKEGYWNNARASVQTMDVVDCLMGCYPGFDIALLYDQSSGHAKKRPNALSVVGMNSGWGGKQPDVRSTTMTQQTLGKFKDHQYCIALMSSALIPL